MRFKIVVILLIIFASFSCTGNYNKNQYLIQNLVADRETDKGFKNIIIRGHKESSYRITVFAEATDSLNKKHIDTINFLTTGDGYIIK